jgi:hypothetical protein
MNHLASVLETNGKKYFEKCLHELNLNVWPKTFRNLSFGRSFFTIERVQKGYLHGSMHM